MSAEKKRPSFKECNVPDLFRARYLTKLNQDEVFYSVKIAPNQWSPAYRVVFFDGIKEKLKASIQNKNTAEIAQTVDAIFAEKKVRKHTQRASIEKNQPQEELYFLMKRSVGFIKEGDSAVSNVDAVFLVSHFTGEIFYWII